MMKNNRVSVCMTDDVLKKVDEYAKSVGISRSSAISVLCVEYLKQREAMEIINKANSILESNQVSDS